MVDRWILGYSRNKMHTPYRRHGNPKTCTHIFSLGIPTKLSNFLVVKIKKTWEFPKFWIVSSTKNGNSQFLYCFWHKKLGIPNFVFFIRPKKNCLVVLHNFFWEGTGGQIFIFIFFFKSKSKLHRIIASISPNKSGNKSTLPKYIFIQV